jgi:hypothetical protein
VRGRARMRLPEIYSPEEVASVINNDDRLKGDPHAKSKPLRVAGR